MVGMREEFIAMKRLSLQVLVGLLVAWLPLALLAQTGKTVPAGSTVQLTVVSGATPPPPVSITLLDRHGHITPVGHGCSHTGGGNTDIAMPSPDTVVVTMTGAAVATGSPVGAALAGMDYDLEQCFEISFDKPEVKAAKLTIEGRAIGLLRSHCCCMSKKSGTAEESGGCATVSAGPLEVVTVCVPAHSVAAGDNLSINDHAGPLSVPVSAGKYTLHQTWHIAAQYPCTALGKASAAEFAPDPALDPLWLSYWEPFHGAQKKDFGFQVTIKVAADDSANESKKTDEIPPPAKLKQPPKETE
jgi:hypothetical protein